MTRRFLGLDTFHLAGVTGSIAFVLTLLVSWHGTPIGADIQLIREVQQADPLRGNEGWVNAMGTMELQFLFVLAAISAAAWGSHLPLSTASAHERTFAIWVLVSAVCLRFLNYPLKLAAQAERPFDGLGIQVARDFAGYGFPSGHVYSDVLIFGALALVAPAIVGRGAGTAVRVACVAIILMAGPARMVVGAHWPSDVAGGYLWGICALSLAVAIAARLTHGPARQIASAR